MNNLVNLFEDALQKRPGSIFIKERIAGEIREYTYEQIHKRALSIASWLKGKGFKKSDRAAILLENSHEWPVCYFGILYAGGVAVPLDIQTSRDDVSFIIEETNSVFCFTSLQRHDKQIGGNINIADVGGSGENSYDYIVSQKYTAYLPDKPKEDDLASIIYTSGTTGKPKGVMLTHGNFLANVLSIDQFHIMSEKDALLSILPLHHAYPFMVTLIMPLFAGARITFMDTLKADAIFSTIKEDGITMLNLTPQVLGLFYKGFVEKISAMPVSFLIKALIQTSGFIRRFTNRNAGHFVFGFIHKKLGRQFRFFVSGGAKLDENVARFFNNIGFTVIEGYGLTETAPVVSFNPIDKPIIGSVGKALPGVNVKISNPDKNNIGEVLISGNNVMKGYYRREQETKDSLVDGWFHTGDLGRINKDGYIFITGRIKEIIVLSSGKNISPAELEKHYSRSPLIKEIAITADRKQEKLAAVVVPDIDEFKKIGEANIKERLRIELSYLSEELPQYQRIKDFAVYSDDLPKTRLGKIKRFLLSDIYDKIQTKKNQQKDIPQDALSQTGKMIVNLIKQETGGFASPDDIIEIDVGLDSLGKVSLMTAIEEKLNINIPEAEFYKLYRVRDLIEFVEQQKFQQPGQSRKQRKWQDILQHNPEEAILRNISIKANLLSKIFYMASSFCLRLLFKLFFRFKVTGRENIPAGRAIICPNHTSYLDGILIYAAVPMSSLYSLFFMAYRAYFEVPVVRHFIKLLKVIPVEPSHNLVDAMKASAYVIKNNKNICLFPEGARSVSGELLEFKEGVGILAEELGAQIVPVYIKGAHSAWKPGNIFPRPARISVVFGKPAAPERLKKTGHILEHESSNYRAVTLGLKQEIIRLKEYSS